MPRVNHILPDQPDAPMPRGMSENQIAEQWYAYRCWYRGYDHPHTLNRQTPDAAVRKEFRL